MNSTAALGLTSGYVLNTKSNSSLRNSNSMSLRQPSFAGYAGYKKSPTRRKGLKQFIGGFVTCAFITKAGISTAAFNELKKLDVYNHSQPKKIVEQQKGFRLDKISLKGLVDYVLKKDNSIVDKNVKKVEPDASAEIAKLKTASYTAKNQRLYQIYETKENNPQLKDYLLSNRMNYINKNMNKDWALYMSSFCDKYGIKSQDEKLTLMSQMLQESALNPTASSKAGAYGLMQVMPSTAQNMNKLFVNSSDKLISFNCAKDYKNEADNIELGVAAMADNLRRYKGCKNPIRTSLAAYNSGTNAVDAYLKGKSVKAGHSVINSNKIKATDGIPPYEETQLYVNIIDDTKNYMKQHIDKLNGPAKEILNE